MKNFDDFLGEAWDHAYSCNLQKLTARGSFSIKPESNRKYVDVDRTFFCSELVAKAYKCLGVFDTDRSSASFFPNSFAIVSKKDNSSNPTLPLSNEHSLSPLFNIKINP